MHMTQESDPDGCMKLNENFIECLGNVFETLRKLTDLSVHSVTNEKLSATCFLGNTGAGKSTLVQILGSDNTKIYSKEVSDGAFIIVDDSRIGTNTVISETLYPELVFEEYSKVALLDCPGFEDNRSSIYEIITMSIMRKLFQHLNKVKIVVVCPQQSLGKGGNRNDFINLLTHVTHFVNDINKFRSCIYLVGTKVENVVIRKNGELQVQSDDSVIEGIASFLTEVKSVLNDGSKHTNILVGDDFYQNATQIIDSFLEKSGTRYDRINILRRPMEEGRLSDMADLQSEKDTIKEMLLNDNSFIEVVKEDFGMVLTDSALRFLNEIFKIMDTYIIHVSEKISINIMKHYETVISKETLSIDEMIDKLTGFKEKISSLFDSIKQSRNPKEYSDLISKFSEDNNLSLGLPWFTQDLLWILPSFKKVCILNEHLSDLQNSLTSSKFSPLAWSASISPVLEFLNSKLQQYDLLKEIHLKLSSYERQNKRKKILSFMNNILRKGSEICENDLKNVLSCFDLPNWSSRITIDNFLLSELRNITDLTLDHQLKFHSIDEDTLLIVDYFVVLSDLPSILIENYKYFNKITIFAMHTIFIDIDLDHRHFKGKEMTIIAPVWKVQGTRVINVDGMSGGTKLDKANPEMIGDDGQNGNRGGKFIGLGMDFFDCKNLTISACGGDGQDGQDGGDGQDGEDGEDAVIEKPEEGLVKKCESLVTLIYNSSDETKVFEGKPGTAGTDSGDGGVGGQGGKKGLITVHSVNSDKDHEISVVVKDGKLGEKGKPGIPGKGGRYGNVKVQNNSNKYVLIIPVSKNSETAEKLNEKFAEAGKVKEKTRSVIDPSTDPFENAGQHYKNYDDNEDIIATFQKYEEHFKNNFSSVSKDGITKKFLDSFQDNIFNIVKI